MKPISADWAEHRIRIAGRHTFLPYYTNSPWAEKDEFFIFFSALPDFSRVWLHRFTMDDRQIGEGHELIEWAGRPEAVVSEELLSSVFLPHRNVLLLPRGGRMAAVDVFSGEAAWVYDCGEPGVRIDGPCCRSMDGALVAFGLYTGGRPPTRSRLIVMETGDLKPVGAYDFGAYFGNHFQFFRDTDWLLHAHEGSTETISDRVNRINWRTGARELLHAHERGADGESLECIGHEMTDGSHVYAVRYPVSAAPAAVVSMRPEDGEYRVVDCDDYWHCSCTPDGRVLAMDTCWWGNTRRQNEFEFDIIRIDLVNATKEIVKSIRSNPKMQYRHPHPRHNDAGTKLLFIEDADESAAAGSITLMELRG